MSWLARSIANSLRIEDDDEQQPVDLRGGGPNAYSNDAVLGPRPDTEAESLDLEDVDLEDRDSDSNRMSEKDANRGDEEDDDVRERGVKEDLSEFTETLTRQLWGVASFLAPPPPPPPPPPPLRGSSVWEMDRRREDAAECSGSGDDGEGYYGDAQFREFSQDIGMPEPEEEEEGEEEEEKVYEFEDAVGITDEVLDFAENTAHHPETWLNFPLSEEEEFEDFEISDSQYKHAQAIEHLAPRLAALRRELCPVHMTEGYFWMVYFVLLHSRLNKHDNDLLSTPQLVKARAMWMEELQKQTKQESDWRGRHNLDLDENINSPREHQDTSFENRQPGYASQMAFPLESRTDSEAEQRQNETHELQFSDKYVAEDPKSKTGKEPLSSYSFKVPVEEYDEHEDDWVDDDSDLEGYVANTNAYINEEDVSFSDLEDDLDYTMPVKPNVTAKD